MGQENKGDTGHSEISCPCKFSSPKAEKQAVSNFLRQYGDGLDEKSLREATTNNALKKSDIRCLCSKPDEIITTIAYKHNDWYLCTIGHLATKESERKKGLASAAAQRLIDRAQADKKCLVLAGDITYDNIGSLKIAEKNGFKTVNQFCFGKGEKPANIVHVVKYQADASGTQCPTGP